MSIPVKIKICGITRQEDAETAAELGADAIGMILSEGDGGKIFDRYISKHQAMNIVNNLPDWVKKVGVFVNDDHNRINSLAEILQLDFVQLHGDETHDDIKKVHCDMIKVIKVTGQDSLKGLNFKVNAFLFDAAAGGSGESFNWGWLKDIKVNLPFFLAGGLNPDNVAEAVQIISPDWVDVSSGIEGETKGIKDSEKMKRFIEVVKNAA